MNWGFVFGAVVGVVLGTVMPAVFERASRVVFVVAVLVLFGAAYVAASSVSADAVFGVVIGSAVAAPEVVRRLFVRRRPVS